MHCVMPGNCRVLARPLPGQTLPTQGRTLRLPLTVPPTAPMLRPDPPAEPPMTPESPSPLPNLPPLWQALPARAWLGWAVLTGLELRLLMLLHAQHWRDQAMAAWGVTIGQPHWRVYQNRLGGPMLARVVSDLGDWNPGVGLFGALLILIGLRNAFVLLSAAQLAGSARGGLRAMALTAAGTLALSDPDWVYLWDYTDLLVFSGVAWLVLAGRGPRAWLGWLLAAAVCKESVLFVALGLGLTGLVRQRGQRLEWGLHDRQRLLAGAVAGLGGALLVEYLRSALLVKETMTQAAHQAGATYSGVAHLVVLANLEQLGKNLVAPTFGQNWLVTALVVAVPVILWRLRRRLTAPMAILAVLLAAMYLSMVLFGVVNETRLYTALVPLAVYLDLALQRSAPPAADASLPDPTA